jgi:hypothetical protein
VTHKSSKPTWLSVLLLTLVTLFTVGCGDSGEDFVVTGNNNVNPATTGNLTFQFVAAQAATVPAATEQLTFDFFNANGDVILSDDAAFAGTVTIPNVPVSATDVLITAYGPGGVPLVTIEDEVGVAGGSTAVVDLSDAVITEVDLVSVAATPAAVALDVDGPLTQQLSFTGTFSNGDVVPLAAATGATFAFSGFDPAVVSVSATGLVTVTTATGGATSIDVAVSLTDDVVNLLDIPVTVGGPNEVLGTLIVQPESLVFDNQGLLGVIGGLGSLGDLPLGSLSTFRAYFVPPGETEPIEVTQRVGVSFGSFVPETVQANSFTYLYLDGQGIAVGTSPLGPTPAYGTTGQMTVTYIDPNSPSNHVYTDNVAITIGDPSLVGVVVPSAVGGELNLPVGTTGFPVNVVAVYSNGVAVPSPFGAANFFGDTLTATSDNMDVTLTGNDLAITGAGGDTGTIDIFVNGSATATTSFDVNTIAGTGVTDVALSPADITVGPMGSYRVIATYDGGATQDLTAVWGDSGPFNPSGDSSIIDYTTMDNSEVTFGSLLGFEGGRLLGREAKGEGMLTIFPANGLTALGLPGADGTAANDTAAVTVEAIITGLSGLL